MVLSADNLSLERGGLPVLEGVSFTLEAGTALVLRGPNGSGKTTLLRTLAGLQPPAGGTLHCDFDQVAYAAHADGIKAMLTVSENLMFWARVFGHSDIAPARAAFELEALRDRPAGALSAGQKRRLGLARLLVTGRLIWVLDEPTVSLDVHATGLFASAVQRHLDAGGVAVIATHIDLGLQGARLLDVSGFRAAPRAAAAADEAFL